MSLLHRDEPPEAGVNDLLAVDGHWLGQHFLVYVPQDPYRSGVASLCFAHRDNDLRLSGEAARRADASPLSRGFGERVLGRNMAGRYAFAGRLFDV